MLIKRAQVRHEPRGSQIVLAREKKVDISGVVQVRKKNVCIKLNSSNSRILVLVNWCSSQSDSNNTLWTWTGHSRTTVPLGFLKWENVSSAEGRIQILISHSSVSLKGKTSRVAAQLKTPAPWILAGIFQWVFTLMSNGSVGPFDR